MFYIKVVEKPNRDFERLAIFSGTLKSWKFKSWKELSSILSDGLASSFK